MTYPSEWYVMSRGPMVPRAVNIAAKFCRGLGGLLPARDAGVTDDVARTSLANVDWRDVFSRPTYNSVNDHETAQADMAAPSAYSDESIANTTSPHNPDTADMAVNREAISTAEHTSETESTNTDVSQSSGKLYRSPPAREHINNNTRDELTDDNDPSIPDDTSLNEKSLPYPEIITRLIDDLIHTYLDKCVTSASPDSTVGRTGEAVTAADSDASVSDVTDVSPVTEQDGVRDDISPCSLANDCVSGALPATTLVDKNMEAEITPEPRTRHIPQHEEISPGSEMAANKILIEDIYDDYESLASSSPDVAKLDTSVINPISKEEEENVSTCSPINDDEYTRLPPATTLFINDIEFERLPETASISEVDVAHTGAISPCSETATNNNLIQDIFESFSDESLSSSPSDIILTCNTGLSTIPEEDEDDISIYSPLPDDEYISPSPTSEMDNNDTETELPSDTGPSSPDISHTREPSPCTETATNNNLIQDIFGSFSDESLSSSPSDIILSDDTGLSTIPEEDDDDISADSPLQDDEHISPSPTSEMANNDTETELPFDTGPSSPGISHTEEPSPCTETATNNNLIQDIFGSFSDESLSCSLSDIILSDDTGLSTIPEEDDDDISADSPLQDDEHISPSPTSEMANNDTETELPFATGPSSQYISHTREPSPCTETATNNNLIQDIFGSFSDESLSSSPSDIILSDDTGLSTIPEEDEDDISICSPFPDDEQVDNNTGTELTSGNELSNADEISNSDEISLCRELATSTTLIQDIFDTFSDDESISLSSPDVTRPNDIGRSPIAEEDEDDISSCSSFDEDESYTLPSPPIMFNSEVEFLLTAAGELETLGTGQYGMV